MSSLASSLSFQPKAILPELQFAPWRPPIWARSAHQQTIFGHYLPSPRLRSPGESAFLRLSDGDHLNLRVHPGGSDVVITAFHGFSGNIQRAYMQRLALLAAEAGHTVVMVNHRKAGEGREIARKHHHPGLFEDLGRTIEFVRERFPRHRHFAVGFSMSGGMLLNLLTTGQSSCHPDGAVVINAPLDWVSAGARLGQGFNKIYNRRFSRATFNQLRADGEKPPVQEGNENALLDVLPVIAKEWKRSEYNAHASSFEKLHRLTVPTYVLTSADDPFVSVEQYRQARWSQAASIRIEPVGGHMGYLAGHSKMGEMGFSRWLDVYLERAISSLTSSVR